MTSINEKLTQAMADGYLSQSEWDSFKEEIKSSWSDGGQEGLNSFISDVADRPNWVVDPAILEKWGKGTGQGIEGGPVSEIQKRQDQAARVKALLEEKVGDKVLSETDWDSLKGEIGSVWDKGGLAGIILFLAGDHDNHWEIEGNLKTRIQEKLVKPGFVSIALLSGIRVHEEPAAPPPPPEPAAEPAPEPILPPAAGTARPDSLTIDEETGPGAGSPPPPAAPPAPPEAAAPPPTPPPPATAERPLKAGEARVKWQITDGDGHPLAGVTITLGGEASDVEGMPPYSDLVDGNPLTTDKDGFASIDLPTGLLKYTTGKKGYQTYTVDDGADVDLAPGKIYTRNVRMPPVAHVPIDWRVTDLLRETYLEGATVTVEGTSSGDGESYGPVVYHTGKEGRLQREEGGRTIAPATIPTGDCRVKVHKEGYRSFPDARITIEGDKVVRQFALVEEGLPLPSELDGQNVFRLIRDTELLVPTNRGFIGKKKDDDKRKAIKDLEKTSSLLGIAFEKTEALRHGTVAADLLRLAEEVDSLLVDLYDSILDADAIVQCHRRRLNREETSSELQYLLASALDVLGGQQISRASIFQKYAEAVLYYKKLGEKDPHYDEAQKALGKLGYVAFLPKVTSLFNQINAGTWSSIRETLQRQGGPQQVEVGLRVDDDGFVDEVETDPRAYPLEAFFRGRNIGVFRNPENGGRKEESYPLAFDIDFSGDTPRLILPDIGP